MSQSTHFQLEKALQNIGFNDKQAKVYLALLELGPSAAKEISVKSGIKKPTTYVILEELKSMDAVLFLPGPKKKLFSSKSPDEVFDHAKEKFDKAYDDLPLIKSLGQKGSEKSIVTYYEGSKGFEQAMKYKEKEVVTSGELVCYLGISDGANQSMLAAIETFHSRIKAKQVRIRGFSPDHATLENYRTQDLEFYKDVKVLPYEMYSARSSIEISQTFVRFALFEQNMFVIIENPEIARVMRQIFEMNWGNVSFFSNMLNKSLK